MAAGPVSEGDLKTAVTLRKSVLCDVVDSRGSLFVLLWHILWRKLGSQIRFSSQTTSCRRLSKLHCQCWTECYFNLALGFTPKKRIKSASFLCASLNMCHNKLDDQVCALCLLHATAVACLVTLQNLGVSILFGTSMFS